MILRISLSKSPCCDSICWHYDKRGNFSVKSAYKVALLHQNGEHPSSSSGALFTWKMIWNLHLPNKIKVFCWRACKRILPTNASLFRKISSSGLCSFCGILPKIADHVLWKCHRSLWRFCPFFAELDVLCCVDFFG
ncbi:hypothetical protein ACOSQ2_011338 [Xanthoceras sorbifolium]